MDGVLVGLSSIWPFNGAIVCMIISHYNTSNNTSTIISSTFIVKTNYNEILIFFISFYSIVILLSLESFIKGDNICLHKWRRPLLGLGLDPLQVGCSHDRRRPNSCWMQWKNVPPLSWKIIINSWIDCLSFEIVFTLLCTTSENHSINWWKNELILWKINSIWMKILNDVACTLNWIEIPFK